MSEQPKLPDDIETLIDSTCEAAISGVLSRYNRTRAALVSEVLKYGNAREHKGYQRASSLLVPP